MPKDEISFDDFMLDVNPANMEFVHAMHDYLLQSGCTFKIAVANNGRVLSYNVPKTKRVLLNYVFRKSGMVVRLYGDNIGKYQSALSGMPENMKKAVIKAPICRRLADPAKCNSRCPMGYIFELGDTLYKKCRYSAFMFEVKGENHNAIRKLVEHELSARLPAG